MGELLLSDKKGVKTYLVENTKWGNNAIQKVLDVPYPNEQQIREFLYEFKLLNILDIPGIRKPAGIDRDGEQKKAFYYYFDGFTIKKLVQSSKNDLALTLNTGIFLARTLQELHEKKVIHRNISANNILYNTKSQEFCLIDFTCASTIKEKKNHLGGIKELDGELEYISPEQTGRINRKVDHRSDLYSVGVVLYELTTGGLPVSELSKREIIYSHIAQVPDTPKEQNPSIPASLSRVIMKLLEKDADNRYQSATGLLEDLNKINQEAVTNNFSDFEPGEFDKATTLTLSQKLYGRESELQELNARLLEVSKGGFSIDLVTGYSGTGKSALVQEAFKTLARTNGYFLSGKFDQLQRNIPYYAIRQAFKTYFKYLLTEEGKLIDATRKRIIEALGQDAGLITEIIPELEHIIGKQPELQKSSGLAGQNQFNYTFIKFLKAITNSERPVVIFLDDLQWADLASLNLLSNIILEQQFEYLLLIGSFRDNEVNEAHPLSQLINDSTKAGVSLNHLKVENLTKTDVINLLADSLQLSTDEVEPLAKMLFNHADGNAFHTTQIIQSLFEQGNLHYDERQKQWRWNKNALSGVEMPPTILELMGQRVRRLNEVTQEVLKKGSCFGNSFSSENIRLLVEMSADELDRSLVMAQEEGFIIGEAGVYFFAHDRIQQAVYGFIPTAEQRTIHYHIGLQLLETYNGEEEKIFDLLDQINYGIDIAKDSDERYQYAELNLRGGVAAKASTAYDAAIRYLENGLDFINADWSGNYQLALELYTNLAEAYYLTGDYQAMDEAIGKVRQHGRELLEQIPVMKLEIEALKSQNDLYKAVEKGLEVLAKLNIKLPYKPNQAQVLFELLITRIRMLGKKPGKLLDLKEMTDPYMLAALQVLVSIGPAIYWASPNLTPLTIFKMLLLSVKYGNTDESTFAYSTYGLLLCGVTGEIKLGNEFGKLTLDLSEKANPVNKVKGLFNVYCFVHHWNNPLTDSLKPFREAFLIGLEAGDLEFSALSAYLHCNHAYYAGVPLVKLEADFKAYSDEIKRIKQFTSLNYNLIHWQAAYNLIHETPNPVELHGPAYDEREMHEKHLAANDKTALFKFHLQKMILSFLFGDIDKAYKHGKQGKEYIDAVTGMYVTLAYNFYLGLTIASLDDEAIGSASRIRKLRGIIRKFKSWAHYSPVNNQHKLDLLKAEYHRVKGNTGRATKFYKQAIEAAQANSFVNELALANELTGKFYKTIGDDEVAQFYLANAYTSYKKWGAQAKCREVLHTYQLDVFINNFVQSLNQGYQHTDTNLTEKLDINSITEATATITDQIDFDQLKHLLLKLLAENAGAEKAILFLVKNRIIALEDSWPDRHSSTQAYAATIVDRALENGEVIVTDRAQSDVYFNQDPHIIENKVRSALCLPLIHQNEIIAIIYLENNVIYGAFSQSRLEFLKILSGQIAIALKNATLYKNLAESYDQQVELKDAYSKFVPLDMLGFLDKESILDVHLGDQIQEVVTVMFIDIVDYTTLSEQMTPKENFDFINGTLRRIGPVMRQHKGVISQFLGDGAMAIFKDSPDQALQAAIGIQDTIKSYNDERIKKGRKPIGLGVGIHTGKVMLGIIGEQMRMDQNVISDNVNIASRVQDLTRTYSARILFTGETKVKLQEPEQFKYRYLGKTNVKGRQNEIEIFECFDDNTALQLEQKLSTIDRFNEAVHAFYAEDYDTAMNGLQEVLKQNPEDEAAKLFLDKSKKQTNVHT
jgi:predicted ATPase/class 3 adenylate cyclase